jgi:hypothetical protein
MTTENMIYHVADESTINQYLDRVYHIVDDMRMKKEQNITHTLDMDCSQANTMIVWMNKYKEQIVSKNVFLDTTALCASFIVLCRDRNLGPFITSMIPKVRMFKDALTVLYCKIYALQRRIDEDARTVLADEERVYIVID